MILLDAGSAGLGLPATLVNEMLKHPWWYLGRSAGFISYGLLLMSVVLGIGVSSRVLDGLLARGWVYEIHRFLSIFVLLAILFHALIMLPDPYAKFSVRDLLVPLHSRYKTGPMALGIIGLYGFAFVTASFYVTRLIGQKAWRAIHYTTFLLFVGATAHGLLTGTDSKIYAVQVFYLASATLVMFLVFYRVLALRSVKPKPALRSVPATRERVEIPVDIAS